MDTTKDQCSKVSQCHLDDSIVTWTEQISVVGQSTKNQQINILGALKKRSGESVLLAPNYIGLRSLINQILRHPLNKAKLH